MKIIEASNYPIVFEQDRYIEFAIFLQEENYSSFYILVDGHTKEYCLPVFNAKINLEKNGTVITIPSGEESKNLETCAYVWNELAKFKADRNSILITIGGGMLTDIGGFIASTFKRGIDFINIPTSLLGMVDASIGGKTGIDFNGLKNQIGLFVNPKMVVMDTNYLKTLPKRELISGMAEIIKYGLTYDKNLWTSVKEITNFTNIDLSELIHRSIEIKNEVVTKDPKEQNLRKILNFGHTIGHAIETYFLQSKTKETLTHGEAIAVGLICETFISVTLYNFPKAELSVLKKYIKTTFGEINFTKNDFGAIIELMKHDKKNVNGEIRFVLLTELEKYKIDCQVETLLIEKSLNYYLS